MTVRILIGDAREKLAELQDESVHCIVTSPPYAAAAKRRIEGDAGMFASVSVA